MEHVSVEQAIYNQACRDVDDATQRLYDLNERKKIAKGFVRPVRRSYRHTVCNTVTTMGQALAETYARDPFFYSGTFCAGCGTHFPVGENENFVWVDAPKEKVGT